jgi:hypothetical protein
MRAGRRNQVAVAEACKVRGASLVQYDADRFADDADVKSSISHAEGTLLCGESWKAAVRIVCLTG